MACNHQLELHFPLKYRFKIHKSVPSELQFDKLATLRASMNCFHWEFSTDAAILLSYCIVRESDKGSIDWTTDVFLDAGKTKYNIRKLIELPHCLQRSGRMEESRELLFSYAWLKAKLTSLSCSELIEDFSAVCPVVPLGR